MPHAVIKMFLSELQINCKPISKPHAEPRECIAHSHRSVAEALLAGAGYAGEHIKGAMLQSINVVRRRHPHPVQAKDAALPVPPEGQGTELSPPRGLFQPTAKNHGHAPSRRVCVLSPGH